MAARRSMSSPMVRFLDPLIVKAIPATVASSRKGTICGFRAWCSRFISLSTSLTGPVNMAWYRSQSSAVGMGNSATWRPVLSLISLDKSMPNLPAMISPPEG